MEHIPSNSGCALVPAALQSGPSASPRHSRNGQTERSDTSVLLHQQSAAHVEGYGGRKALMAFPRPRSSIDEEAPGEASKRCDNGDVPVDPRLERRRKNQYKRHGSLTLAWQQKMSADQSARSSRLSSEIIHESCSSMPVTAGASPLSTPVAPYQRTFQHHSRISQTASASSGDIVSMRSSIGNSGGNIGKPSLKWKSGSFTAACVDRLPRSGSIRHGVAGFINAISSDNRRSSQVCKDAVIDDDAYCVPACDSNDDASAGNLFAPVNGSRASSRMSISSTEQYAESSNTHRSLSSYIAYYIQDATAGQADPADDASELSRFMQSSCTVDPSHESSNSPTHEAPSTSAASRSATTPKSKALAALCASSSASSIHCALADSIPCSNGSQFSQEDAPHLPGENFYLEPAGCKKPFSASRCRQAAEPCDIIDCCSSQCSVSPHSVHSSSASALGAVDRKCMAGTCSELSDNRVDSTNNADVGIESQWLATVARQDMPKQSGQAAVNQQFAPPGRTDSSRQHGKQCAHLQPPTRPDLCVRGMDEEANTPSASECAPVEYVKDDDLVPLGLRARMQSSGRVGASESVGKNQRSQVDACIHEGSGRCSGASGGCASCSNNGSPYCVDGMNEPDSAALLNAVSLEAPTFDTQSADIGAASSHCASSVSALSSSSTNSFVFVSGVGSKRSSAGNSSDGALFFSSSCHKQNNFCTSQDNKGDTPLSTSGSYIYLPSKFPCCFSADDSTAAHPVASSGAVVKTDCLQQNIASVNVADRPQHPISRGQHHSECSGSCSSSLVLSHQSPCNSSSASRTFRGIADSEDKARYRQHRRLLSNPPSTPLPILPREMTLVHSVSSLVPLPVSAAASASATKPTPAHISPATNADIVSAGHTASSTAVCTPIALNRPRGGSSSQNDGEMTRVDKCRLDASETCLLTESPTNLVAQKQKKPQHRYMLGADIEDGHHNNHGVAAAEKADRHANKNRAEIPADPNTNRSLRDLHMHTSSGRMRNLDDEELQQRQQQFSGTTRHPTMVFDHSPILCTSALIETSFSDTNLDHDNGDDDDDQMRQPECHSDSEANGSPSHQTRFDRANACRPRRMRSLTESSPVQNSRYECHASGEVAHDNGYNYVSKSARMQPPRFLKNISSSSFNGTSTASRGATPDESLLPMPRPHTAATTERVKGHEVAEKLFCRNSLFTNAVKQQSRCMSVLLQQGSHGGIRRIGPLLITTERGGSAIKHLNPAFIDMMDVQPVDKGSIAFLKKSNIRRRSFSMPPGGPGSDWLDTLSDIIGASKNAKGTKQGADRVSSTGPGMWWPLNDDNCSDEVSYDVHIASLDSSDASREKAGGSGRHHGLERTGSSNTIASTASLKPQSSRSSARKGSVSSQLRLMARPETSSGSGGSYLNGSSALRQNVSYNGFAVQQPPTLPHLSSDTSESTVAMPGLGSRTPQSNSSANMQNHSFTNQLADVTMKTESGLITRSVKCVSLRVLVNRLASPEGNVDSDLMTDFLNSYRFFAHPIDVMRLIVVRYLNCFDNGAIGDEIESSDADDADSTSESDSKYLTINGWRNNCSSNAVSATDTSGDSGNGSSKVLNGDQKPLQPSAVPASETCSKKLPLLVRNDGAIIQLRVMNIIKYWIKFHPHDFRLHHRLTRLLLLFLSHIQKQPGRADFVNAIRQKLSSGRLLAVEMPAFASSTAAPTTAQTTAVPSQASSIRSSCIPTPTIESARSAIDLQSSGYKRGATHTASVSAESPLRVDFGFGNTHTTTSLQNEGGSNGYQPKYQLYADNSGNSAPLRHATDVGSGFSVPVQTSSSRPQTVKKGSTSYFRSLFQSRSSKSSNNTSNSGVSGGSNANNMQESGGYVSDAEAFGGYNSSSVRISQRGDSHSIHHNTTDLSPSGDVDEYGIRIPNGNMYASDFGLLVMEALAKSGVPTPQTPVGRTLLNYTIANRNPYRINLVGIDPATFAEQLTLLEHELFSRISATEFSLKGRVGNLETILHTMQGAVTGDSRNSVSTLAGGQQAQQGQTSPNNPVPSLTAMTSWFNQATYWTVLSVLSEPTTAARALVVKQLIHVALHCLARRNYYGAFEIVIALDNSAVRRLNDTWALVPELMKEIVAQILEVLQSRMNFRTYRESLKAALSGVSGPDEEIFNVVAEQIKIARAKDLIAASSAHAHAAMAGGASFGGSANGYSLSSSGSGFGNLVHGAFFGGSSGDDGKSHSRKKSNAPSSASMAKNGPLLTEQDCACITYAIRIRAASFMYFDPSAGNPGDGTASKHGSAGSSTSGHNTTPAYSSSKSGRGSAAHMSSGSSKSGSSALSGSTAVSSSTGKNAVESSEPSDSRSRRARSTSNGNSGMFSSKNGGSSGFKQGQMLTNGAPLPLVPFIAVHMTDLFHADQANATYSEEHQKMRSRNPTGPDSDANSRFMPQLPSDRPSSSRRQARCDSTAISSVNQAQPLLNMQKFRLITTMFRELHLAQRTKYPYAADVALQQQIHSAVRNIKAQVNDISSVVEDIVTDDPTLARPMTSYSSPFARTRTDSSASRTASEGVPESAEQGSYGYPLYQTSSLQKNQAAASLFDTSMDWDFADLKDNQELEQRLYMLSKWVEPSNGNGFRR